MFKNHRIGNNTQNHIIVNYSYGFFAFFVYWIINFRVLFNAEKNFRYYLTHSWEIILYQKYLLEFITVYKELLQEKAEKGPQMTNMKIL